MRIRNLSPAGLALVGLLALAPDARASDDEESKKGTVDAGPQVAFPSGPDETGAYGMGNWLALDVRGKYYLTDKMGLGFSVPMAVVRPDDYQTFGGFRVDSGIGLGDVLGVGVTVGMMRQGAFALGKNDFPAYSGALQPGLALGPTLNAQTGIVNLYTAPSVVVQLGSAGPDNDDPLLVVGLPVAASVELGQLLKLGLELGVNTGENLRLGAKSGARLPILAEGSVKLGPVFFDGKFGFASLITSDQPGSMYPSIKESMLVGANVRYAK